MREMGLFFCIPQGGLRLQALLHLSFQVLLHSGELVAVLARELACALVGSAGSRSQLQELSLEGGDGCYLVALVTSAMLKAILQAMLRAMRKERNVSSSLRANPQAQL